MNRHELASIIDHTLLTPEATRQQVDELVAQGLALGVRAVCVAPSFYPLNTYGLIPVTVVGFPSGAHQAEIKAQEAARAVNDGVREIDMVMNLGLAKQADWTGVQAEIETVRKAVPAPCVLRVIIESAALNAPQIVAACWAAEDAGADAIKTSTGFHPAGGATPQAVSLIAKTVHGRLAVKAAGGISTAEQAIALVEAGANVIGTSHAAEILAAVEE
ncbi:MAG: deoxyribose-phosphate aldolase [Bifidobacteriaceae bacterium]|nr:deoxyribose-phosphate aldolase [Bifidobacteriaceae bacterium]